MNELQLEEMVVSIVAKVDNAIKDIKRVEEAITKVETTTQSSMSKVQRETKKVNRGFGTLGKAIIAAFSIRAIVGFFRKYLELTKQTEKFREQMALAFQPLITTIQPVMDALIRMIARGVAFITGLIQGFFPNLSKGSDDSTKDIISNNKAIAKSYAGFDELNVISNPSGSSASAPAEITALIDQKEVDKLVAMGKQMAEIAKWFLLIVGLAAGMFVIKQLGIWLGTIIVPAAIILFGWLEKILMLTGGWKALFLAIKDGGAATGFLGPYMQNLYAVMTGTTSAATGLAGSLWAVVWPILAIIAVIVAIGFAIKELWSKDILGFQTNLKSFWENMKTGWKASLEAMKPFFDFLKVVFIIIWEGGLKPLWDAFIRFIAFVVLGIIELVRAFDPLIDFLVKYLLPVVSFVLGGIIAALAVVLTIVLNVVSLIIQGLSFAVNFLVGFIAGAVDSILRFVGHLFDALKLIWDGIKLIFTGNGKQVIQGIGSIFLGLVVMFSSIIIGFVNLIVDVINGIIKGLNGLKVPDWVPLIGGKSLSLKMVGKMTMPTLPKLADGGMLNTGQLFIAGEAGAEMVGTHQGKTTVMPLENTNFVSAIKQAVIEGIAASSQGSHTTTMIVDGMTLAKAVENNLNKLSTVQGGLNIAF